MLRRFVHWAPVMLVLYVLVWNVGTLRGATLGVPARLQWLGYLLRLDQCWQMFVFASSDDGVNDGWFVIPGLLRDGRQVDVFTGGAITWQRPSWNATTLRTYRWREFLYNLPSPYSASYLPAFSDYLCRRWNDAHDPAAHLVRLNVLYLQQRLFPSGRATDPERVVLWRHRCPSEDASGAA